MVSSRRRNTSSRKKSVEKRRRRSRCGGKRTEKKSHNRWIQRGCQNQKGGGSMTGGWAWGASDVHHQTAGSSSSSSSGTPQSINGNHYALNNATLDPPQASNAIVERQNIQSAGRRRGRGRGRSLKGKKKTGNRSRRIACQSGGGFLEFIPEILKPGVNTTLQAPTNIVSGLQGPATPAVSADPTSQPIAKPIALQ